MAKKDERDRRRWGEGLGEMANPADRFKGIFEPSKKRVVTDEEMYLDEALSREVDGLVQYMNNYHRFGKLGYRGVILKGPPGTGKTLLAWYLASKLDADVFFYESTSGVRDEDYWKRIFEAARQHSMNTGKWSFIFVDEIDSVIPKRDDIVDTNEMKGVSQILRQMDSLHGYEKELMDEKTLAPKFRLMVIGATNKPNNIDEAARRAGRFDREIEILAPDKTGRRKILEIHEKMQRGFKLPDELLDYAVGKTPGYTGGDLRGVFNTACEEANREAMSSDKAEIVGGRVVLNSKHIDYGVKRQPPSGLKGMYFREPTTGFGDIIGYDDLKKTLELLVVDCLKDPGYCSMYGLSSEKGILLYGPSGTVKTSIATAIAKEAGTNMMFISGPELYNKFFGETEKTIRDIFEKARHAQPSVVVFDMLDTMTGRRDAFRTITDSIQGQLLTVFKDIPDGVVVVGTTNSPERLDPAMCRPETLGCKIYVPLPDKETRAAYFSHNLAGLPAEGIDYPALAGMTEGYNVREIERICGDSKRWYMLRKKGDGAKLTQSVVERIIGRYPHEPEDPLHWENIVKEWGTVSLGDLYDIR